MRETDTFDGSPSHGICDECIAKHFPDLVDLDELEQVDIFPHGKNAAALPAAVQKSQD